MSFKNKVVLITGGSSGIGAATAIKYTEEGAHVVIVGRQQTKLRDVSIQCEAKGSKPFVIIADVSNDEDVKRIISTTIDQFGKLDILVNNAGTPSVEGILSENAMEIYDKTMATNLRAVVYLTHLALPYLMKTKGNILNVSSAAGIRLVLKDCFAYQTSKAGLDQFTRAVALELAPKGVRANSVNPGLVRTDILQNMGMDQTMGDAYWNSSMSASPLGKIALSEEIADLILFVTSDKAGSITGTSFVADNGAMLIPQIGEVQLS